jgi:putative SbcD/Mre11-related phosphoesterase
MKLTNNIEIIDLTLYLKKEKILILTDTHIGYEEALNKQGVLIPRTAFKDLIKRLENILKKVKPLTIIINGDIKHEFGKISDTEWRNTLKLIAFLKKHCKNLILIKGNHDKTLGPIANKKDITITDNVIINNTVITHGHKLIKPDKKIKTIIIGHEHPAITIKDLARREKFKCFLKGKYKNKTLIVQPSLSSTTYGSDVLTHKRFSPFLKKNIKNFEVFVVAEQINFKTKTSTASNDNTLPFSSVYAFGKIKNLITN